MLNPKQFLIHVVRPVLDHMDQAMPGAGGAAPEQLVLGTCMAESNLEWLKQIGGGPAEGPAQMEPATFDDILRNYVGHNAALRGAIEAWSLARNVGRPVAEEMRGNWYLAVVMCRLHYRRRPEQLPGEGDAMGMARYWKRFYNTTRAGDRWAWQWCSSSGRC